METIWYENGILVFILNHEKRPKIDFEVGDEKIKKMKSWYTCIPGKPFLFLPKAHHCGPLSNLVIEFYTIPISLLIQAYKNYVTNDHLNKHSTTFLLTLEDEKNFHHKILPYMYGIHFSILFFINLHLFLFMNLNTVESLSS